MYRRNDMLFVFQEQDKMREVRKLEQFEADVSRCSRIRDRINLVMERRQENVAAIESIRKECFLTSKENC